MAIQILRETNASPGGLSRFDYLEGMVYDSDSYPPTSPALETQAVAEGWAVEYSAVSGVLAELLPLPIGVYFLDSTKSIDALEQEVVEVKGTITPEALETPQEKPPRKPSKKAKTG